MVDSEKILKETPSQTAGPYLHIGCTPNFSGIKNVYQHDLGTSVVSRGFKGNTIKIEGKIFDGDDAPLLDALIEVWQADPKGVFNSPNGTLRNAAPAFNGWGRVVVDPQSGLFQIHTVKPGPTAQVDENTQAPHINFWIVARGINIGLQTRMYFEDEGEVNSTDPVLSVVTSIGRDNTLLARRQGEGNYRFDIHLQGPEETVFFDV